MAVRVPMNRQIDRQEPFYYLDQCVMHEYQEWSCTFVMARIDLEHSDPGSFKQKILDNRVQKRSIWSTLAMTIVHDQSAKEDLLLNVSHVLQRALEKTSQQH